jgi:hypothetical protein
MNFMNSVINEQSLSPSPDHLLLDIRIPWYRSLPLSCVARLDVAIDGISLPLDDAEIDVNGLRHRLDELPDRVDEVWFIQDNARVRVPYPGGVPAGAVKDVEVRLDMRIPYIIVGPDSALNQSVTNTMALVAAERTAA